MYVKDVIEKWKDIYSEPRGEFSLIQYSRELLDAVDFEHREMIDDAREDGEGDLRGLRDSFTGKIEDIKADFLS